jgi:hypothetical protein
MPRPVPTASAYRPGTVVSTDVHFYRHLGAPIPPSPEGEGLLGDFHGAPGTVYGGNTPGLDQESASFHPVWVVPVHDADRRPPDRRLADQDGPVPDEMGAPTLAARIEEPGQSAGRRVGTGDVRPLKVSYQAGRRGLVRFLAPGAFQPGVSRVILTSPDRSRSCLMESKSCSLS